MKERKKFSGSGTFYTDVGHEELIGFHLPGLWA